MRGGKKQTVLFSVSLFISEVVLMFICIYLTENDAPAAAVVWATGGRWRPPGGGPAPPAAKRPWEEKEEEEEEEDSCTRCSFCVTEHFSPKDVRCSFMIMFDQRFLSFFLSLSLVSTCPSPSVSVLLLPSSCPNDRRYLLCVCCAETPV